MSDDFELIHGSGNVFADFGHPNAEVERLKAALAAQIIRVLDGRGLTVRAAEALTGTAAADFSRIRRVKLDRFTIDRLMTILGHLGQPAKIQVQSSETTDQYTRHLENFTSSQLIVWAFHKSVILNHHVRDRWMNSSFHIGALMPDSLLTSSVQRLGELDVLLRTLESEAASRGQVESGSFDFAFQYQHSLSELWVGSVYEVVRLILSRHLVDETKWSAISHRLRLLRVPMEKHELAMERKLADPLRMTRRPHVEGSSDDYVYSKQDPKRSHIMPSGLSSRWSVMWQVTDIVAQESFWLERRQLADDFLALAA